MPDKKEIGITQSLYEHINIVGISGEVDLYSSPQLRKCFNAILQNDIIKILITMDALIYMDSSGLATLIELYQKLKQKGGLLAFTGLNSRISNLFEITRLETIFKIFPDRDQAIAYLKS